MVQHARAPYHGSTNAGLRSARSGGKLISPQTQIRYLISTGRTQWEGMERYIDGL
jgi:hypothetical protein